MKIIWVGGTRRISCNIYTCSTTGKFPMGIGDYRVEWANLFIKFW